MKRGDIILLDFNNARGHEQKGYRPAVVLSHLFHNQKTGMAILCPVTTRVKGYDMEVVIEAKKVKGVVVANQIQTMDVVNRKAKVIDCVSLEVLNEILRKLKLVIE